MPTVARFALLTLLVAVPASAQEAAPEAPSEAHRLPFGAGAHAVELSLGEAGGHAAPLSVRVASAPPWAVFDAREAPAAAVEAEAEPVARLAFAVGADAPVGQAGTVVLEVVDAAGAVVGRHETRLVVAAPERLALSAPRPNPARGAVRLDVAVPGAGRLRVAAHDVLGREVAVLADGERAAGGATLSLAAGSLAAGVYVVRAVLSPSDGAAPSVAVRRLTVVR